MFPEIKLYAVVVYMCIFIHMCTHTHAYTQKGRKRDRETETEIHMLSNRPGNHFLFKYVKFRDLKKKKKVGHIPRRDHGNLS